MAFWYYDSKYETITEERFDKFVSMRKIDPNVPLFYFKDMNGLINDIIKEFGRGVMYLFLLGFVISIIFAEGIMIFIPIALWLIPGGFRSIYNFIEDFNLYNNFNKKLNLQFNNFKNYNEYCYFVKFGRL